MGAIHYSHKADSKQQVDKNASGDLSQTSSNVMIVELLQKIMLSTSGFLHNGG